MSQDRRRWTRRLSALTLSLALAAACASGTAKAQEPAPPEGAQGGDSSGRPLDGYLATACLAALVLFIVGKSARR